MNLINTITFDSQKPNVAIIKKNDHIKYFAVALGKDAVLQKHTTAFPATLVVLKGEISFKFEDRNFHLISGDTFDIPVNEVHEVQGLTEENLFTVLQELSSPN